MDSKIQKQLVESACRGDIDSFGKLYEHYYATIVWMAYSIVLNLDLAEDVAQQSFLAACENLGSLRNKGKFAGWLSGICRNTAYSALPKLNRQNVPIDELVLVCENGGSSNEENKKVQQAVFSLPQMYREIVILHYYNDMSYEQIKKSLGISLHSVKGRLRRARKKIEKYLINQNFDKEVYYETIG